MVGAQADVAARLQRAGGGDVAGARDRSIGKDILAGGHVLDGDAAASLQAHVGARAGGCRVGAKGDGPRGDHVGVAAAEGEGGSRHGHRQDRRQLIAEAGGVAAAS